MYFKEFQLTLNNNKKIFILIKGIFHFFFFCCYKLRLNLIYARLKPSQCSCFTDGMCKALRRFARTLQCILSISLRYFTYHVSSTSPSPPLPLLNGYSFLTLIVGQCCVERCLIRRGLGWLTTMQNL